MAKRDKMVTKSGTEIDCNIVGFMDGLNGGKIIIYTTFDNEKELLASYYALKGNKIILSEIKNDDEWDNIEKQFKELEETLKNKNNSSNKQKCIVEDLDIDIV